ncbi:AAA family ATPase [Microbacterium sp. ASV49]|uniref:AAA family ATPase n=1 Tax=Microbacterium candidum TaxID=3041922 RepID=A0ABT7MTT0_9MICO|nr:AAA family ATPase [Microbacterium sp. ASV49]MDL9977851.1 AAA family ATPase [Microbacterium sp. ASV49]
MSSTYIESGSRIRVYDSAVSTHAMLPLGTYRVHFSSKEGFSLLRIDDLTVGTERVYGHREQKVDKIFSSYHRTERSLGVMLSGDKGQGKSLFLRMVAERAIDEGIAVVLVTEDADGIVEFLDSLDECLVIFDEFEKIFPSGRRSLHDGTNRQNQFLTLFDGMSSVKRIYCVTVNDIQDVSAYIVNRPGRFHYHMRFDYPGPDEVREYLRDQAPLASAAEVESAALFSRRVNLNYDHLRAIAFELNDANALFADIVEDLNIKAVEPSVYRVEAKFADGTALAEETAVNLFERGSTARTIELRGSTRTLSVSFFPKDLVFDEDGTISVPPHMVDVRDEYDDVPDEMPVRLALTLIGQTNYSFDG